MSEVRFPNADSAPLLPGVVEARAQLWARVYAAEVEKRYRQRDSRVRQWHAEVAPRSAWARRSPRREASRDGHQLDDAR